MAARTARTAAEAADSLSTVQKGWKAESAKEQNVQKAIGSLSYQLQRAHTHAQSLEGPDHATLGAEHSPPTAGGRSDGLQAVLSARRVDQGRNVLQSPATSVQRSRGASDFVRVGEREEVFGGPRNRTMDGRGDGGGEASRKPVETVKCALFQATHTRSPPSVYDAVEDRSEIFYFTFRCGDCVQVLRAWTRQRRMKMGVRMDASGSWGRPNLNPVGR